MYRPRRGFSLLELVAVVALLGILVGVGASRMRRGTLFNVGAQGDARRIALDLLQARRRSISTGDNHFVRFTLNGSGKATAFAVYRRSGVTEIKMEATRTVSEKVIITPSATDMEFTFEGNALASYTATIAGDSKSWNLSVIATTGTVRVVQAP